MLHIAVCDDEPAQCALLEKLLYEWAKDSRVPIQVDCCRNGEQFFFLWEEKKDVDLLLLDIDMPGMDGMSLAHRLREKGGSAQIIFVTGVAERAPEGYEVEAVSYLLKPVKKDRLFTCLDRALERLKYIEPELLLEMAGETQRVRMKDIRYLESCAHDTFVYTEKETEALRSKTGIHQLEEILQKESGMFFKLHRSYLVNLVHIAKITKKEVVLDNEERLPIARGRWEELNRIYMAYYRGKADD